MPVRGPILLIEDDEDLITCLRAVLEDAGVVRHQSQVLEIDLGELGGAHGEGLRLEIRAQPRRAL